MRNSIRTWGRTTERNSTYRLKRRNSVKAQGTNSKRKLDSTDESQNKEQTLKGTRLKRRNSKRRKEPLRGTKEGQTQVEHEKSLRGTKTSNVALHECMNHCC